MQFAESSATSFQEIAALAVVLAAATHLAWRMVVVGLRVGGNSSSSATGGCGQGCHGCTKSPSLVVIAPLAETK
ncbi:MAG: hypothetical protein U1A77_14640 [Pirellulales bacterium]